MEEPGEAPNELPADADEPRREPVLGARDAPDPFPVGAGTIGPPYRVVYPITADAAIDAARLVMAPLRRRMTVIAVVALAGGLVLTVAGDGRIGPGIALFGLLAIALTVLRGPERMLVNRRGGSLLRGHAELVFGEAGVDFASPQAAGREAWSALTGVIEDARSVVLLRDRALVGYAPTAAFGPPERRAEVVAYIRAQITAARPRPTD